MILQKTFPWRKNLMYKLPTDIILKLLSVTVTFSKDIMWIDYQTFWKFLCFTSPPNNQTKQIRFPSMHWFEEIECLNCPQLLSYFLHSWFCMRITENSNRKAYILVTLEEDIHITTFGLYEFTYFNTNLHLLYKLCDNYTHPRPFITVNMYL